MNAAALSHDALQPRAADQVGLGAALALLAHGGLVAALALSLNWRLPATPPVVTAELWSAVPKVAAPAPVEPAPAPPPPAPPPPPPPPVERPAPTPPPPPAVVQRDADIALERAKREQQEAAERERQAKLEQKRLADERAKAEKDAKAKAAKEAEEAKEKAAAEKLRQQKLAEQRAEEQKAKEAKDAKAKEQKRQAEQAAREKAEAEARDARHDEERIARQREANLKRILGEAGATGSPTAAAGTAARDAGPSGPSAAYAGRIKARVKPNIKLPGDVSGNPVAEVEVRCAADGTIIGRRITKPSGNAAWDEAVLRAIDLTAKLPLDDGKPPPGVMTLVFPRQE